MEIENTKFFWAPTIMWEVTPEGELKIENIILKDDIVTLFPKFYFLTQDGITLENLHEEFKDYSAHKLEKFIQMLKRERFLVDHIQRIDDLFYRQADLYEQYNRYDESIRFEEKKLEDFVEEQLSRKKVFGKKEILLLPSETNQMLWRERKSVRSFNTEQKITFTQFSDGLEVLRQYKEGEKRRYYYPSAGGLYPIDVYIYVKPDRIENVSQGLYYYDSCRNQLQMVSDETFDKDIHYFSNQNIFASSACSVYFIYHADASMPKYEDRAIFYAIIDAGIMAETLTMRLEEIGIGSCIIGEMNFEKIAEAFELSKNETFLFNMEFGLK